MKTQLPNSYEAQFDDMGQCYPIAVSKMDKCLHVYRAKLKVEYRFCFLFCWHFVSSRIAVIFVTGERNINEDA